MPDSQEKHHFVPFPNGEKKNSCLKCSLPQNHTIHHLVEMKELKDETHPLTKASAAFPRLARDELFMRVAELFAIRSSCTRGHVGAVLVKDKRIISSGYNGAPPGMRHCLEVGCDIPSCTCDVIPTGGGQHEPRCAKNLGCQRTIHAEANSLLWAARMGIPTLDSIMYSTHSPCATCARLIIAAGISKVYFRNDYRLARLDILDSACVLTEKI